MKLSRIAVLVAALVTMGLPCEAALAVRKTVAPKDVPAWAREAAARPVSAPEAAAAILHEELIVEPQPDRGVRITSRLVVKILKRESLDRFGSYRTSYRKDDRVLRLRAWTFLPDGSIRIPDPNNDVDHRPYVDSGTVFEDTWLGRIDAASGSTGATIAYEVSTLRDLDFGAEHFVFGDPHYPTVFSRASLSLPAGWESSWLQTGAPGAACERIEGGIACEARDLKPPVAETRRPPMAEISPGCWLRWSSPDGSRGFRDWSAVGAWGENLTRLVLKEVGGASRTASRLKPNEAPDLLPAIGRAFAHAARDVRYVSIQLGIGGYRPHPPAAVAKNLFGDCKDKSFLLRAILQEWGRPTYFLMVRTRGAGDVDPEVPTPGQFDHMIAAVSLPDGVGTDLWSTFEVEGLGRLLPLDATAREGSAWNLRDDVQGTLALLVHPSGGTLVRLPTQPPGAGQAVQTLRAAVDENGRLTEARVEETWSGSLAADMRSWYATSSEQDRLREVQAIVQADFPGGELGGHTIEGLDRVDENVRRGVTVRGGRFGRRVATVLIVQPGDFASGVIHGSFPPPPRAYDLVLGVPMTDVIDADVAIPAGWRPESLRPEFVLDTPELSARATWTVEGGRLHYRREARLRVNAVPAARYAEFRSALMLVNGADVYGVALVRD